MKDGHHPNQKLLLLAKENNTTTELDREINREINRQTDKKLIIEKFKSDIENNKIANKQKVLARSSHDKYRR